MTSSTHKINTATMNRVRKLADRLQELGVNVRWEAGACYLSFAITPYTAAMHHSIYIGYHRDGNLSRVSDSRWCDDREYRARKVSLKEVERMVEEYAARIAPPVADDVLTTEDVGYCDYCNSGPFPTDRLVLVDEGQICPDCAAKKNTANELGEEYIAGRCCDCVHDTEPVENFCNTCIDHGHFWPADDGYPSGTVDDLDLLDALRVVCHALTAWRDGEDANLEELKYMIVDRAIECAEPWFDGGTTTADELRANIAEWRARLTQAEGMEDR